MNDKLRTTHKIGSLKESLARQTELDLAEAIRQLEQAELELQQLQNEYYQLAADFDRERQTGISGQQWQSWILWLNQKRHQIELKQQVCRHADEHVNRMKELMLERHREKQIWQRLYEKQLQIWKETVGKLEQTELDEVSIRQYRAQNV
ncbi:flagellar export protein FliJ [Effusibacillus dendaii]|uniref:Flagellar FliJ protein n=1 Tax=Effusibacillus dendaii TaxID=2743772 RepID=A0A7I8D779_9BACL|nr:flagellar export protein FliJ [Effusibacillus dendaii]BCJ85262.1 hypothetical protein skT53_02470 [Effusibacillus dendaii]